MTVLVTRPLPKGNELVFALNQKGIKACHTPLISFSYGKELHQLPIRLAELKESDMLFASSQPAVDYANQLLKQNGSQWPTTLNYFAVGQKTAKALQAATGCPVDYPIARENSENLLALPALQSIADKKILILRGNGGREYLALSLQKRGALVRCCECYQRVAISYNGSLLSKHWQTQAVNTIVITSAEMVQHLFTLVPKQDRPWLLNCRLLVVSERIAILARQFGWQQVLVADNADNHSVFNVLTTHISLQDLLK